ncbi:AMP-binding protein [Streptomyces sp. SHP 1-2]|uniref:AMP-binding protein n=1 Tax=Streptomyces sp. SHP 1-2 TaxID=2769489 RepID=UPI002236FB15|nr:AMP-binding protein [Streptomyces sp. SHP 1-2]MCW5253059.1 AMP-binding protein [Streptomyces sp. SHP 1-2]
MRPDTPGTPDPGTPDPGGPAAAAGHVIAPPATGTRVDLIGGLLARAASDAVMVRVLSPTGGPATEWSYRDLIGAAGALAGSLTGRAAAPGRPVRVGLVAANSPEWVTADLATLFARAVQVPVPTAFSAAQAASLLEGADVCLVDAQGAARLEDWARESGAPVLPGGCEVVRVDAAALAGRADGALPPAPGPDAGDAVVKVIHTSGTTSAPKGVRIRLHGIESLITSLIGHVDRTAFARYLSVVPLSLLIEQVAGLYMPFLAGGSVTFLPPGAALVGTAADAAGPRLRALLRQAGPTAMVVPPTIAGLLLALCEERPEETVAERHRRIFGHDGPVFIACGGAPVPVEVLRRLDGYGITLYEGYGLSENSSVVSWNFPGQTRFGTAGRPLAHVHAELAEDGELLIRSDSLFAGYTREDPSSVVVDERGLLHTGDLAVIDEDGYIRITGRKKNVVITAGGRNLSPEWIEAQYRELGFVREAAIVADGLDAVHGLFVVDADVDHEEARARIEAFGRERLSGIERASVVRLMDADDPDYTVCFTVTGRPRRDVVRARLTGADGTARALEGALA